MFIETQGRTYLGPAKILVGPRPYLLFIGKPAPNRSLRMVRQEYPAVAVLFLLLFSGGLCYFFVRSILRPIVQLQNASKLMATGDLSARVGSASLRLDEIGQLGRDFNLMSVKVQSSLTSQKRLLADVSHELRSPLTRLQLSIGIAQQQSTRKLSEDTLRALQRIDKEALQIEAMIAQILTLSRLETQEASCDMERVTLGQIMAAAISDGQFEAQQQNKTLNYTPTTDLCFMAQPQLLISAIENVLRNAIYHSNKCIHISVEQKNSHISWSITDDGSGIDEQQLERVFEAFFRDPTKHTKAHKGTGLGLAIARHAVIKHQGTIRAKNNSQGGLTVIICLPFIDG
jgi:two-component system sensor histidine kinase CpxA